MLGYPAPHPPTHPTPCEPVQDSRHGCQPLRERCLENGPAAPPPPPPENISPPPRFSFFLTQSPDPQGLPHMDLRIAGWVLIGSLFFSAKGEFTPPAAISGCRRVGGDGPA